MDSAGHDAADSTQIDKTAYSNAMVNCKLTHMTTPSPPLMTTNGDAGVPRRELVNGHKVESNIDEVAPPQRSDAHQQHDAHKLTRVKSLDTCRVCGDGPARMHYGVPTCFGCKGFFRRTLKRPKEYTCRYNGNCIVDRYERNSCRHCRFKRCLEVGMDPKAVRPDRDAAGRSHPLRYRRSHAELPGAESADDADGVSAAAVSSHATTNDDWIRKLPVDMRTLLMQIMNIELIVANGDTNIDAKQLYPLPFGSLHEILQRPSLLDGKRTEMRYETFRRVHSEEFVAIAHRRLVATIDIIDHLCGLMDINNVDDKVTMVKSTYAPLWILCCVAATARTTRNRNILCMCQFGYVPRGLDRPNRDSGYEEPYYFANRLVDRILDELVEPFRTFNFKEQEIVLMKVIVALNPHLRALSTEASEQVADFRDRVQETLYNVVRESHPKEVASSRFGNLLLFLPSIMLLGTVMYENLQFIQSFGAQHIDPLLTELLDNIEPIEDRQSSGSGYNTGDEAQSTSQYAENNASRSIMRHSTSALSMSSTGTAGTGTSGSSYEYLFNDLNHSTTTGLSSENLTQSSITSQSHDNLNSACYNEQYSTIPQNANMNLSEAESDPDYNMTLRADNYPDMRNAIVHSMEVDNVDNGHVITSDYFSDSTIQCDPQSRPNFYIDPMSANSLGHIPQDYIDRQQHNVITHQQQPNLAYCRYSDGACDSMADAQRMRDKFASSSHCQSANTNYTQPIMSQQQQRPQNPPQDPNFRYDMGNNCVHQQKAVGTRHVFTIEPTKNVFPEIGPHFQSSNVFSTQQQTPQTSQIPPYEPIQQTDSFPDDRMNRLDSAPACRPPISYSCVGMGSVECCVGGPPVNPIMQRSANSNMDASTSSATVLSKSQSYPYILQEQFQFDDDSSGGATKAQPMFDY